MSHALVHEGSCVLAYFQILPPIAPHPDHFRKTASGLVAHSPSEASPREHDLLRRETLRGLLRTGLPAPDIHICPFCHRASIHYLPLFLEFPPRHLTVPEIRQQGLLCCGSSGFRCYCPP